MTEQPVLFSGYDPPDDPRDKPERGVSADQKRTRRQAEQIKRGIHPLTGWLIHDQADIYARADDGKTLPYRCGSCRFRQLLKHHDDTYPKCVRFGDKYLTHGPATDIRAWWPACASYEPGDGGMSPDAARWLP